MKIEAKDDGLFCDWLSIWQVHPAHAPLNSGRIVTYDGGGTSVFERHRAARIQGSHSTSCSVKSDGRCVVLSGNFGRLNRSDNLFNFDPLRTLERANVAAQFAGLPLFQLHDCGNDTTPVGIELAPVGHSQRHFEQSRTRYEHIHLSRIDLTKNYSCGSVAAARSVIRAISGKSVSRVKKGVGGDASVWWSNTRYMLKVYIKALEMEAHGVTSGAAYEYARDNGIIRLEIELKRRELSDLGWSDFAEFLRAWDMGKVHNLFADYEKILTVEKISNDADFIDALPQKLRVTAAAFLAGRDVKSMMSRRSFFRYRKALLDYGIDISDERPAQLNITVRTVEVKAVTAPDWYWQKVA
ncbi:MAG: phage/plasmid replication protein, II/X family [bacterium]|nr:phage/plasmid replication protein, II/X family [bacterium]